MQRSIHRNLKLGLVLVAATALLALSHDRALMFTVAFEKLDVSAGRVSFSLIPGIIAGFFVIPAALWVDRRSPHQLMALGAATSAVGLLIVALTANLPAFIFGSSILGLGGAATGSLILYLIALKGTTHRRGALVGALALIFATPANWLSRYFRDDPLLNYSNFADGPLDLNLSLYIALGLAVAAAILLFTALPKVYNASKPPVVHVADDMATFRASFAGPQLWKIILGVVLATAIARSILTFGVIHLNLIAGSDSFPSPGTAFATMTTATIFTVLLWAIAADYIPARRLLIIVGLLSVPLFVLFVLASETVFSTPGLVAIGALKGALIVLPWLLIAEHLSVRRFATWAVLIIFGTTVLLILMQFIWIPVLNSTGPESAGWVLLAHAIVLIVVAARLARPAVPEMAREDG